MRMNVWQEYVGKKVFIRTRNDRTYSGVIVHVDDTAPPLYFIALNSIKGNRVMLVHSEIVEIKEEQ